MAILTQEPSIVDVSSPRKQSRPEEEDHPVQFHVTGFKQFFNVPVNPTELIVNALPGYISRNPLSPSAELKSTNVFTVAAKTTLREIATLYTKHAKEESFPRSSTSTIFVHLGVNMSINKFYLEAQAKNEATFSCPDELGWTPIRHAIDPEDSDITCVRKTTLDLQFLIKSMRALNYDVGISHDAGRFVCNWIYFNSLKQSKASGTQALFVHVPSTSSIPLNQQVKFVADLLQAIAHMPTTVV